LPPGEITPPAELTHVIGMAGGSFHGLALTAKTAMDAPTIRGLRIADGTWNVQVSTQRGRKYRLEFADSLAEPVWRTPPCPPTPGNNSLPTLADPDGPTQARFYRVRVE
jgi:hypothetical protein